MLLRVLWVSLGVLGVLGAFLILVRFYGLSQPVVDYPLAFLERNRSLGSKLQLIVKTVQEEAQQEGTFTTSEGQDLNVFLSELLRFPPETKAYVLSLTTNNRMMDLRLEALFRAHRGVEKYVGFHSESEAVTQSLKAKLPEFAFAASLAEQMRLLTYESLLILPATKLKTDFWFGSYLRKGFPLLTEGVAEELSRQRKPIYVVEQLELPAKAHRDLEKLRQWIGAVARKDVPQ